MFIASLIGTIGRYIRYRSQLASIKQLDEHILRDIGISRDDVTNAAWSISTRAQ